MMHVRMNAKGVNMGGEVLPEQGKQKPSRKVPSVQGADTQTLSYEKLITSFKKSLRNGNWRHLNPLDKTQYRASLWYAKHRGSIVNASFVEKLLGLIEKLKEMKGMKIFRRGFKKAVEKLKKGEEEEVFTWAPQLKHWLKDPSYIFWLGTVR